MRIVELDKFAFDTATCWSLTNEESSTKLRKTIDDISKHHSTLKSLQSPVEYWDTLVIYILFNKLDERTSRKWQEYKVQVDLLTLDDLKGFIKGWADLLETLESNRKGFSKNAKERIATSGTFMLNVLSCIVCKVHTIFMTAWNF